MSAARAFSRRRPPRLSRHHPSLIRVLSLSAAPPPPFQPRAPSFPVAHSASTAPPPSAPAHPSAPAPHAPLPLPATSSAHYNFLPSSAHASRPAPFAPPRSPSPAACPVRRPDPADVPPQEWGRRVVTTRAAAVGGAGEGAGEGEEAGCVVVGAGVVGLAGERGERDERGERVESRVVDFEAREREEVECVVVGAGVVGLAVARALAVAGREVLVVEAGADVGGGISSRNSEVIHAGLYYAHGSLKARLCVEGRRQLYAFCEDRGVPHRRVGKLVVATSADQVPQLQQLKRHAEGNGVEGLRMVSREEARLLEPHVDCHAALLSPHTGILDSHALMLALQAEAEAAGAVFAFNSAAVAIQAHPSDPFPLLTTIRNSNNFDKSIPSSAPKHSQQSPPSPSSNVGMANTTTTTATTATTASTATTATTSLYSRYVVNAAGLEAVPLAYHTRLRTFHHSRPTLDNAHLPPLPPLHLARGHYFAHAGAAPFSRLVYPLPEPGGLGVHATLDLAGRVRFGPDVQWLNAVPLSAAHGQPISYDYSVDPSRATAFYAAIRKYFPSLQDGALHADYAGIRPKLTGPGEPAEDFLIQRHATHGIPPGLINLLGIESPGLTSSLAIADHVKSLL
ncbi:hypothetical protein CLOM_g24195 [Closterium sp. NIES-68]|nr:hypothetical protein CLOM_g24195 [Closterium sp. NIES-68]GJP76939.1 hypothetical protein CLOP_g7384 [Closterium sp. NIES-67]